MKVESLGSFGNISTQNAMQSYNEKKNADFKSLLNGIQTEQNDAKIKAACDEIESLFVYEMLKQMRSSIPKGGLIPEGPGEKIYRDMLDEEYSKIIVRSPGRLGLSDLLYRQLKRDSDLLKNDVNNFKGERIALLPACR